MNTSTFQHILVGVDFSDAGQAALRTGVQLALRERGVRLSAFHLTGSESRHQIQGEDGQPRSLRQALLEAVRRWDPDDRLAGRLELRVALGDAPGRLLELIDELGCDLVVVGPSARSTLERWTLGSVSRSLLRDAPCPVWLASGEGPEPLRCVVAGIDYSDASIVAVRAALQVAAGAGTPLHLVHVATEEEGVLHVSHQMEGQERLKTNAEVELERYCLASFPELEGLGLNLHFKAGGDVPELLAATARELKASLLVLGHHQHGFLHRIFVGSTAERLLERTPCHLLITHGG